MSEHQHVILIVEDKPESAEALVHMVKSMDCAYVLATTLEEVRARLAELDPCAVLQDIQIPFEPGARPHENCGESSIKLVRKRSAGPVRVPIVVITAFRSDPDFVWKMGELEADDFCEKSNLVALTHKLTECLRKRGRENHESCARCNAQSRPMASTPPDAPVATLFSHDRRGVALSVAELAVVVERRAELDLFLNFTTPEPRGYAAGFRDRRAVYRETFLSQTHAAIVAELVEERRAVRANAMKCVRDAGLASAVRLVQQARKMIDVNLVVDGRESRTKWRAIRTVGDKAEMAFCFEPSAEFRFGVIVRGATGAG